MQRDHTMVAEIRQFERNGLRKLVPTPKVSAFIRLAFQNSSRRFSWRFRS